MTTMKPVSSMMMMRSRVLGDRLEEAKEEKHKPPTGGPRSLIISPNLEALLEYDEQARRVMAAGDAGPLSAPPLLVFPVGLPPPPRARGARNPRSSQSLITPSSSWVGSIGAASAPCSPSGLPTSNPYINPAPLLDADEERARDEESARTADSRKSGEKGKTDQEKRQQEVWEESRASVTRNPVATGSKYGVDKLVSISRNAFGRFSEGTGLQPKTELNEVETVQMPRNLRPGKGETVAVERTQAKKGKLAKAPNKMQEIDKDRILVIRRKSISDSTASEEADEHEQTGGDPVRQRPLLSHGPWRRGSSSSSSSSSSSGSSGSTQRPASTIEARISISSTIYPASSSHSHPPDMYDPAPAITGPSLQSRPDQESFIEIHSPTPSQEFTLLASQPVTRVPSPKPPVPTTPKPIFTRSPQQRFHQPKLELLPPTELPPTTNFLDLDERSDLIRKNRKLTRVFGQTPSPDVVPCSTSRHGHHRAVSNNVIHQKLLSAQPPCDSEPGDRRRSIPLTSGDKLTLFKTPAELYAADHANRLSSPTSFIDLSDDPGTTPDKKSGIEKHRPYSPSNQSIFENMTPEQQAEEERRRKREKLAKLHRFLGSRVPANLVLGFQDTYLDLPLPPLPPMSTFSDNDNEDATRKAWLRRRRSSSAAAFSPTWSDELDRFKGDLNDKEKAINVRRAQKMEKVFGIAPPQTLYHTRRSPSPCIGGQPKSSAPRGRAESPAKGQQRNPNRSAYTKSKKTTNRPGTSESKQRLLPKSSASPEGDDDGSNNRRESMVYTHYQHSLNSLNDIIDRDDKESLAELHQYLSYGDMTLSPPLQDLSRTGTRRLSSASSIKSERRRSLPTRTSMISLASVASEYSFAASLAPTEYSEFSIGVVTPKPDASDFQARRRRAAKLTQFFGVDYRELISDVLESIESGLEHERKKGTLKPDEVEDLLARLRGLRMKRGKWV